MVSSFHFCSAVLLRPVPGDRKDPKGGWSPPLENTHMAKLIFSCFHMLFLLCLRRVGSFQPDLPGWISSEEILHLNLHVCKDCKVKLHKKTLLIRWQVLFSFIWTGQPDQQPQQLESRCPSRCLPGELGKWPKPSAPTESRNYIEFHRA
jgi:hypothetical protein